MKKYLTREECRKIQINILKILDDICKKNEIKYSICQGTLLGAVKYNGFIPWDDDIDIMLLRKDYIKLINILKKQKDNKWLDVLDFNTEGYYYPFAKAVDNRTVSKQDDIVSTYGIWVDIFPIDYLPNDDKKRKKFVSKNYRKRSVVLSMLTDFKANKKIKHLVIKRLLNIYSKFINKSNYLKKYNKYEQKYNKSETKYVGNMFSPYGIRECFDVKMLTNLKKYKFEDGYYYGINDSDTYLGQLYGNYKEEPPAEKRRNHKILAWRK